jgi:hypothetical protein
LSLVGSPPTKDAASLTEVEESSSEIEPCSPTEPSG